MRSDRLCSFTISQMEQNYVQVSYLWFYLFVEIKGQAVVHANHLHTSARAEGAIQWYLCCVTSPEAPRRTLCSLHCPPGMAKLVPSPQKSGGKDTQLDSGIPTVSWVALKGAWNFLKRSSIRKHVIQVWSTWTENQEGQTMCFHSNNGFNL